MRRCICGILCLLLCVGLVLPTSAVSEYTVAIPEERKVASGGTVSIPLTVSGGSYNAADIKFTFDADKLTFVSSTLKDASVKESGGTIRVRFYGAAKKGGSTAFSLTFQLQSGVTESSEVEITSAKVDNSDHALSNDAPEAKKANYVTKITPEGYSVTLPNGFTGEKVAYPGKDYTFSKPAGSTNYTVSATVNGKAVPCKKNADGTYTIEAKYITGPIIVTAKTTQTTGGTSSGNTTGTSSKATYKQLWVQPYVELDDATVFLIAISGTPKSGQTYAYNGAPMYFTKKYTAAGAAFGENLYLYLQIVKSGEPLLESDVAEKITAVKGTSPVISRDLDMDGSGEIDAKDAQTVYNVYNAMYWNFDELPMAWFLAADLNLDGIVNVEDADVIVDGRTAR